jgi:DNA (cytosine-5)-methyltransferase 1
LKTIVETLEKDLGYSVKFAVLNALDYGLPQKRERVIIVGHKEPIMYSFPSPVRPFKPLSEILEKKVDSKHFASDYIAQKKKNPINLHISFLFGMKTNLEIFARIHIHVL